MAGDLEVVPYGSDYYVELDVLLDSASGAYVNDAAVTVTLYTKAGVAVAGASALNAVYVASSNGKYRALVPRTASVVLGHRYRFDAVATKGGLQMVFSQEVVVQRTDA